MNEGTTLGIRNIMKNWRIILVSLLVGNTLLLFGISILSSFINIFTSKHLAPSHIAQVYIDQCNRYIESQRDKSGKIPAGIDCTKSNYKRRNIVKTRVLLDYERESYIIQVIYINSTNTIDSFQDVRNGAEFCEFEVPRKETIYYPERFRCYPWNRQQTN
jgi:hypothetical protein